MRVLDTAQMREADRRTIDEIGIPSIVLMENAGRAVADAIDARFAARERGRVAVLCGRGSNGGDGLVVARVLAAREAAVSVVLLARAEEVKGDARTNLDIARRLGLTVTEASGTAAWEAIRPQVAAADLVVDALVGTGLRAPLEGLLATVVADVNAARRPVVAVDLPSGLSADTGACIGACLEARITVTLGAPKTPLVVSPAAERAGRVVVADIGIPARVVEELAGRRVEQLTRAALRARLPARARETHKGDHGRVVVVAGSQGKTGAARLAGTGALRSGAGLVTVALPASCVGQVAAVPEYMTSALPETEDGTVRDTAADVVLALGADVVAVGPGLGVGPGPRALVRALVERVPGASGARCRCPSTSSPTNRGGWRSAGTASRLRHRTRARWRAWPARPWPTCRRTVSRWRGGLPKRRGCMSCSRVRAPSSRPPLGWSRSTPPETRAWRPAARATCSREWWPPGSPRSTMWGQRRRSPCICTAGPAILAANRVGETALVAGDVADHLGAAALELANG